METDSASCKKNTANQNSSARKGKQNKIMLLSKCALCGKRSQRQGASKIKNSIH